MSEKTSAPTTEFSKKLTKYINESGYTVSKLSQITELGRTSIQHTMSGKLIPARGFMDALCPILPLTPAQLEELMELYQIEKVGARTYHNRIFIKKIIERLSHYRIKSSEAIVKISGEAPHYHGFNVVSGVINVNNSLRNIIIHEVKKEDSCISTSIPFDNALFYDMAVHLFAASEKPVTLNHYMRVFKREDSSADTANLHNLDIALKLSLNPKLIYRPMYYYAYKESLDDFLPAFPYGMITSDYAAIISADFRNAVISDDEDFYKIISEHVKEIDKRSMLMIESVTEGPMFNIFLQSASMFHASIEYQPCLTAFLTENMIKDHIKDIPGKNAILETISTMFFSEDEEAANCNRSQVYTVNFTKEGLENFTETGRMRNLPGELLNELTIPERIQVLEQLKENIDLFTMLDSTRINVPEFMQIISLSNRSIIISCLLDEKRFCCLLNESGLCSAFEDFISNLEDENAVFDREYTVAAIDECIGKLRKMK